MAQKTKIDSQKKILYEKQKKEKKINKHEITERNLNQKNMVPIQSATL